MKIFRFLLCLFFFGSGLPLSAQDQQPQYLVSAGMGMVSTEMFRDIGSDVVRVMGTVGSLGNYNAFIVNRHYSPTFHLSLDRRLSDEFSLVLLTGYEKATGDYQIDNVIAGHFQRHSVTVAAGGKYYYLAKDEISLYGSLAIGYTFNRHSGNKPTEVAEIFDNSNHFNGHISPFGIRIGKKLGWFGEVGFGSKGLFNGGLNYRF